MSSILNIGVLTAMCASRLVIVNNVACGAWSISTLCSSYGVGHDLSYSETSHRELREHSSNYLKWFLSYQKTPS